MGVVWENIHPQLIYIERLPRADNFPIDAAESIQK